MSADETTSDSASTLPLFPADTFMRSRDGMLLINEDHLVILANRSFMEITWYEKQNVVGRPVHTLGLWESEPQYRADFRRLLANSLQHEELSMWRRDGASLYLLVGIRPVQYEDARHYLITARNITAQKLSLLALKDSEESYRRIFNNLQDIYFLTDSDGTFKLVSPSFTDILGWHMDEVAGTGINSVFTQETDWLDFSQTIRSRGKVASSTYKWHRQDGSTGWFSVSAKVVFDEDGVVMGIEGLARDVTETITLQQKLKIYNESLQRQVQERNRELQKVSGLLSVETSEREESQELLSQFFNYAETPMLILDISGNITKVNNAVPGFTEYSYSELQNKPFIQLLAPEEKDIFNAVMSVLTVGKPVVNREFRLLSRTGRNLHCTFNAYPLTRREMIFVSIYDITARLAVEEELEQHRHSLSDLVEHKINALAESELRYQQLLNAMDDMIVVVDREEKVLLGNPVLWDVVRKFNSQATTGAVLRSIMPDVGDAFYRNLRKVFTSGDTLVEEITYIYQDKPYFWECKQLPVFSSGRVDKVMIIIKDITARKLMEDSLMEKESLLIFQSRQARIGEMLNMIAHQWRQPLAAISALAGTLQLKLEDPNQTSDYYYAKLEDIQDTTEFLSRTVDDFRDFYSPRQEKENVRLHDLIMKCLSMLEHSLTVNQIEVKTELNPSAQSMQLYPGEVMQVVLELVNNARNALVERSVVGPRVVIRLYEQNNLAVLEVEDNAGGVNNLPNVDLFAPYFTTRRSVKGTGLGLYLCKLIVEKHHGGTITVQNGAQGALFRITLPREL